MDLSLHVTRPADVSIDTNNAENTHETSRETVEDGQPQDCLLGNNNNSTNELDDLPEPQTGSDETPKHDKYKEALDAICKTWSEVKLLQMKSSDIQYYLNKAKPLKGDKDPDPPNSPVRLLHAGRPLRRATGAYYASVVDPGDDSDDDSDFIKSPSRKHNISKPHASGPSASRVGAQNKRTGTPGTVLPSTSRVYNRLDSPEYSEHLPDGENTSNSSSGSS